MGEIARVLLAAGAPKEGAPDSEETPIVTAASYDQAEVASVLVRAGAQPRTLAEAAGAGDLSSWPLEGCGAEELAWALRGAVLCERLDVIDQLLVAGTDTPSRPTWSHVKRPRTEAES